jgi:hypothetical protein
MMVGENKFLSLLGLPEGGGVPYGSTPLAAITKCQLSRRTTATLEIGVFSLHCSGLIKITTKEW